MDNANTSLSYAVRADVMRSYLSRLALVLVSLTLVPLLAMLLLGEIRLAGNLLIPLAVLILLWLPGRHIAAPSQLQVNEAMTVVALTFIIAPLLMLPPFIGEGLSLPDALFETISAITTTGLSTLSQVHEFPPGLLLLRAWMQWYGGLGIAVFSVALVIGHISGARRLTGLDNQDDLPKSARTYARQVLLAYLGLTVISLAAIWAALGDGMQALLHTLAAVSTGGFSGYDNSLADMPSSAAAYLTIGAAVLGALPLVLYYQLATRQTGNLSGDPEWWSLPLVIILVVALLALLLHADNNMDWSSAWYHAGLLGASAQSTAGFSSMSIAGLSDTTKLILVFSMLVGGSIGSTAGGIKLLRMMILTKLVAFILRRTAMPRHSVAVMRLGGRGVETDEIQRALVVILLFALTVWLSWVIMVAAGQPAIDALFEVVSAVATVGLSTGIVDHQLATGLKLLLCVDMLLGRLEILALLVVLYPPTWFGKRVENR